MCREAAGVGVGRLTDTLDAVAATDTAGLDDQALQEQLLDLLRASHRLHAEIVRRVEAFDRRGSWLVEGCRSAKSWLQAFARLSGPVAHRLVKTARVLRQLPKLAGAAAQGEVSDEHLLQTVRLVEQVGLDKVADVEATLADAARALDPASFAVVCARVQAHVDPDGPDPGEAFTRRQVTLSAVAGMLAIRGQLDPEGGAALATALDSLTAPPAAGDERSAGQRRADALVELARLHLAAGTLPQVGGQRPQVGVLVYPQALSPRLLAKLADAQREGFTAQRLREFLTDPDNTDPDYTDGDDTTSGDGAVDPTDSGPTDSGPADSGPADSGPADSGPADSGDPVGGTVDESGGGDGIDGSAGAGESAPARPGWLGTPPPAGERPADATGWASAAMAPAWSKVGWADPPWLQWVGPIPAEVAQRIACDADLFRVILDPASGMPLDVGRSHRLVPYWMRKALYARDRGCRWPGCQAPAPWTDGHHLDWWLNGGATRVDRCLLLCRHHHGLVHEGKWSIDLDLDTGEVHVTRPGGLPYVLPGTRSASWNGPTTHTR